MFGRRASFFITRVGRLCTSSKAEFVRALLGGPEPKVSKGRSRQIEEFHVHEKVSDKLGALTLYAYRWSRLLHENRQFEFRRVGKEIMLSRPANNRGVTEGTKMVRPSFLCFVPLGCAWYDPARQFDSQQNFKIWLRLVKEAMDLNAVTLRQIQYALHGLSFIASRAHVSFIDQSTFPTIERMYTFAFDKMKLDSENERSYCKSFRDITRSLRKMFSNVSFTVTSSAQPSRITACIIDQLPVFCRNSTRLIAQGDQIINKTTDIADLVQVLFLVSSRFGLHTKQLVKWKWLKSVVQDLVNVAPPDQNMLKHIRYCLGQLAVLWTIEDRRFWTWWLSSYFWDMQECQGVDIRSLKAAAYATAASIEALLRCPLSTAGLVTADQKSELLRRFSQTAKFLNAEDINRLKKLVTSSKESADCPNVEGFCENDFVEMLVILNSYKPAEIVYLQKSCE